MKLIVQMASRERQVRVAAAPSQNQSVQEAKESGKGDSQGRKINCPPKTATQVCSDLLRFGFSPSGGGLRGIGQDMSKSDLKGLKSNYKTVLCELWDSKGRCQYGPDCHFAHGEEELKKQNLGEGNILKGGTGPSQDSTIVEGSNKGGDKEVHINMEVKEFHEPQTPTEVWVTGDNIPNAIKSFTGAGLQPILVENMMKYGFKKPTPVQMNAIPIVMASRDLMALAQTGSGNGKTAAFLLPIIHRLIEAEADSGAGPQCIVVTPTGELALQIHIQACMFAQGSRVRSVVAYGSITPVSQLQRGCNILIATPDMLLHLVEERNISVSNCKYLVLDDADRMWDGEFLWEIHELVEDPNMPKQAPRGERQTLIFSTALPNEMQESAQEFLAEDYLFLETDEPQSGTWTDPNEEWGAEGEDWH